MPAGTSAWTARWRGARPLRPDTSRLHDDAGRPVRSSRRGLCECHSATGVKLDGGYRRSAENADLAAGYGRVLVLSPFGGRTRAPLEWGMQLAAQVRELRALG